MTEDLARSNGQEMESWCELYLNGYLREVRSSNMRFAYTDEKKWNAFPFYVNHQLFVIYLCNYKAILFNSSAQVIWHNKKKVGS